MTATAIHTIGLLAHPLRPQTAPVANQIVTALQAQGVETWLHQQWTESTVLQDVKTADVVIAIGGDGAMLRAARACAPFGVPVLGINMGYLGFLTEINSTDDWRNYLDRLLHGDYWVEERMMIHTMVQRGAEEITVGEALNDVVISRSHPTKMVVLETYIDRHWATTYNADALIISTPTGSTAYALATGGPILPPELRNILIIPVAPHLSMDRPIVLSEGSLVEVVISDSTRTDVALAVDGALACELQPRDIVSIQAADPISRFVRFRGRNYFYRSLLDRLEPRLPQRPEPERPSIHQRDS